MSDKEYKASLPTVTLQCAYCLTSKVFLETSFEATSGCTYFCSGDCEDMFAWFEEPIKPHHKETGDE